MEDMAETMYFPTVPITRQWILDNAIHACKSLDAGTDKYIQVSGRIQEGFSYDAAYPENLKRKHEKEISKIIKNYQ